MKAFLASRKPFKSPIGNSKKFKEMTIDVSIINSSTPSPVTTKFSETFFFKSNKWNKSPKKT